MKTDKHTLLNAGIRAIRKLCKRSDTRMPKITVLEPGDRLYATNSCGYYRCDGRDTKGPNIWILPRKCAHVGNGIRSFSWPGYVIDRTPYGVLAHELGHHVDHDHRGLLEDWITLNEMPLTNYHGTGDGWVRKEREAENFAEMFRLFVTNPDLLKALRPKTFGLLRGHGFVSPEKRKWKQVLRAAPKGIRRAAENKIWACA
jgi:hypothetical protein